MILLAIDPAYAKPQAWAMFKDGKLLGHGLCVIDDLRLLMRRVEVVYCENQYIGKNGQTIKKLAHIAGRIEQIAHDEGKPFHYVEPFTWMKLLRFFGNHPRSQEVKILSMHVAKAHTRDEITDDEAAAICIGLWAVGEEKRKAIWKSSEDYG